MQRIGKLSGALGTVALFAHLGFASDYPFRGLTDPASQLEVLSERCQDDPTPDLLTRVGWLVHVYRNENQKARQLFQKALEAQPQNGWARYGLAIIDEIEGRFDSMLSNSLALCENSPSHPVALLALLNVRGLFGQIPQFNHRVEGVLRALLDEKRSGDVQFDEICREMLSAISRTKGDLDGLKRHTSEGGPITQWRVVGPFGEYPNLSFLSKWPPETHPALKARYKGAGKIVERREYSSRDGYFRPHWATRGLYYAETFLRSRSSQEVILRISSPFPVELFVNNHLIYKKDSIRSHEPLIEYVRTRLCPGGNRLLMKCLMGSWGLSANASYKSLRLRCLAPAASLAPVVQVLQYPHPFPAVSISASPRRWRRIEQVEHSPYEPPALSYFSTLSKENPRDPLAFGLCGILRTVQGDVQGAKRFLLAAEKHAPSYAYFNYVLGGVLKNDPSLPVQVRRSEAKARFLSALDSAQLYPLALYELALLDVHEDKDLEAIDKLNECVTQSPRYLSFHERLYRLYERKDWRLEQRRQLQEMLGLGIESCEPYHVAEDFYRATKQYEKLVPVMERLQSMHVYPEYLAHHFAQSGQDSRAISEYLKLKADQPQKPSIRKSLVQLYERNGRWVDAKKELKDALKLFPRDLSFWKMLAELKGYTGRTWSQRQTWRRVLRRDPVDQDVRNALKASGWKDPLDAYPIPSMRFVHDASIREKYAGVSSAMIIDQAVEEIFPNGSSRQMTHQLILLNDKKAIDRWGELDIPEQELLELRTIKKDGTVVEPEPPEEGKMTFSMAGLQEGDFIEYKYITATSTHPDRPPRYLGPRFFFQSVEVPMELSQYVILVPEDMKLQYEQVNHPPSLSVMRRKGKKVYTWEARNVPAAPREPLAAAETEFLPFVRVGIHCENDAETLRYQDHNIFMTRITDDIKQATTTVLADCPVDIESRARAVYSFVNREIRGGGGSAYLTKSASETLADKHGDRLALAKAMLGVAGIKTRMLVARGKLSHESKVFADSFDSGLLAIQDGDGRPLRYLDFSSRYFPYGYIRANLQGGSAVPLLDFSSPDFGLGLAGRRRSGEQVILPEFPFAANCENRSLQAALLPNGSIEGMQRHTYTGDRAASLRETLLGLEEYRIRELIERIANASFRVATLTRHELHSLSDAEKPLSIEYDFHAPNFGRIMGREMLLDQALPLSRLGAFFATLEARKTPLQIERSISTRFRGALNLPPGTKVITIPSPLELETDFGHYHLRFAEQDNSIRIEFDLQMKAQRIASEDYPKFADFCRAIDEAERREIKLRLES